MKKQKPNITDFQELPDFVRAMLAWRRAVDPSFSVRQQTKTMAHCSPTLVTHVANGKRSITERSLPNFTALLNLDEVDLMHIAKWVHPRPNGSARRLSSRRARTKHGSRSTRTNRDWLEVYVRSALAALSGTTNLETVFAALGGIAPINRVHAAVVRTGAQFSKLEDQARTTIHSSSPLRSKGSKRETLAFYRQALEIAKQALRTGSQNFIQVDLFLDQDAETGRQCIEKTILELKSQLDTLHRNTVEGQLPPKLYQFVVSLAPVGGSYSSFKKAD